MAARPDAPLPVTVIIPTTGRRPCILRTVRKIQECLPQPDEILIWVDGPMTPVVSALQTLPHVRCLADGRTLGPGGARGVLLRAARHETVVSLDDDSHPVSPDFFHLAHQWRLKLPEAAIFSAVHPWEAGTGHVPLQVSSYSGCGCVFNRDRLGRIPGFVPEPMAYGIEEVDASLQIHDRGGLILRCSNLVVEHERSPDMEVDPQIAAHAFANSLLFTCLRFPLILWPLGLLRSGAYACWLVRRRQCASLWQGLRLVPGKMRRHFHSRAPVSSRSLVSWLWLGRHPIPLQQQSE